MKRVTGVHKFHRNLILRDKECWYYIDMIQIAIISRNMKISNYVSSCLCYKTMQDIGSPTFNVYVFILISANPRLYHQGYCSNISKLTSDQTSNQMCVMVHTSEQSRGRFNA